MNKGIKKVTTAIRSCVKEFFKMLAQNLIDEEVYEALNKEREHTRWMNDKANLQLLETIIRNCPDNQFIVLSSTDYLYQGLQETRNVMRAQRESAFVSGTALGYPVHSERPITASDYQTAYAINPYSDEFRNNPDKAKKDIVNCFNGERITYFEYAYFN